MAKGVCSQCGHGPNSKAHYAACKVGPPVYQLERKGPVVTNVKTLVDVSKLPLSERVWYKNRRLYPGLYPAGV